MPCPYYRGGACHSPKLDHPSDSVVAAPRCGGPPEIYMGCSLFVEGGLGRDKNPTVGNTSKGGVRVITKNSTASKIYSPIHMLKDPVPSDCPFYRVESIGSGYIASCQALKRLLTKYEAKLCSLYWRDCPYLSMARVSIASSQRN